jgi:hypothetical protein
VTRQRAGAMAAAGYALLTLTVAGLQAVVLRFRVVETAELARDVVADRTLWMIAQAVLVGQQELLALVGIGLLAVTGRARATTVVGLLHFGAAALMFVLSGIAHGVFGTHLGGLGAGTAEAVDDTLRIARVLHALGDTTYFAGLALLALAMIALGPAIRATPGLPRGLAALGLAAAAATIGGFGWFVLPALGFLSAVGVLLQACWFAWLGRSLWRASSGARMEPSAGLRPPR